MVDIEQDRVIRQHKVTYLPDHDAAGGVCGVYAISDDVTERNQLIADLRLARLDLETLLNAVPASISSWQQDLTFRFANQKAKRRFVIPDEALVGAPMREVIGAVASSSQPPRLRKLRLDCWRCGNALLLKAGH